MQNAEPADDPASFAPSGRPQDRANDPRLYLTDSGWHLDPRELRQAVDAKLQTTRVKRWRSGLRKAHLDEIERTWEPTLREWIEPSRIPDFADTVRVVEARLRALGL